jgi:uncharacterized protein (TIGR04255 family)
MDYNEIKYARNFIKQVICRIDFLEFLTNESITNPDVIRCIRTAFPVTTMQQIMKFNNIGIVENTTPNAPPSAFVQSQDGIQQEFFTHDQKNKLVISNAFFLTEFTSYSTFEEMCDTFTEVLKMLFSKTKLTASRTGLRYVNIFSPEEISIKKTHLAAGISSALDAPKIKCDGGIAPIRSLSLSEYRKENMNINFRFGLFNKNYPNPSKGSDFVLDYDCFTLDPLTDYTDVIKAITEAHANMQVLFENSISDSLRRILRNE